MTVEPLLAHSPRRRNATMVAVARAPLGAAAPLCIVASQLRPGDGTTLARRLGRKQARRVVVLTRYAERREVVQLLAGGLRGAVALSLRSSTRGIATAGSAPSGGATRGGSASSSAQGSSAQHLAGTGSGDRSVPLAASAAAIIDLAPVDARRPPLTAGELRVLRLVAAGRTNRLIGAELALSVESVKSHLARMSRKLGTGDRAGLVATAIRTGQLEP